MRRYTLFLFVVVFLSCEALAQTVPVLNLSAVSGQSKTVLLSLMINSPAGQTPGAVQWTLNYPATGFSNVSVTGGPVATTSAKIVSCKLGTGKVTCVTAGLNSNTISNGVLATVQATSLTTTTNAASLMSLAGTAGSTAGGATQAITSGATVITTATTTSAPSITTSALAAGTAKTAYSQILTGTGGKTPYSWSLSSGTVPAGLAFSPAGVISGTPTTAGTSSFTVRLQDSAGASATRSFSIVINPAPTTGGTTTTGTPSITTTTLVGGTLGKAYSQAVAVTGGKTPYTWSISAGTLPSGLALTASTGVISGTPKAAGNYAFTVRVQDAAAAVASRSFGLAIGAATTTTTQGFTDGSPTTSPAAALATSDSQTGRVLNAASLQPNIAPGGWVTIQGSNLSGATRSLSSSDLVSGHLPSQLDGVGVTVNGRPVYVAFVSPAQINALMPTDLETGVAEVRVFSSGSPVEPMTAQVLDFSPALFLWHQQFAMATHLDFSVAAKAGTFTGTTTVPAKPGETIMLWGTGLGATIPAAPSGQITPAGVLYQIATPPVVTIGGLSAEYVAGALAPGEAGLYQIAVRIPETAPQGDLPVTIRSAGFDSGTTMFLTVEK